MNKLPLLIKDMPLKKSLRMFFSYVELSTFWSSGLVTPVLSVTVSWFACSYGSKRQQKDY
jgi:hypothetical protein